MIFWLDAQLPPQLAPWLAQRFGVEAYALREIGLRDASDRSIFAAARDASVVLVSKDIDFVDLGAAARYPAAIAVGYLRQRHQWATAHGVRGDFSAST